MLPFDLNQNVAWGPFRGPIARSLAEMHVERRVPDFRSAADLRSGGVKRLQAVTREGRDLTRSLGSQNRRYRLQQYVEIEPG